MDGRADLAIWQKSAQTIENFLVLPQGGVQKRRAFQFIDDITALDADVNLGEIQMVRFNFRNTQQYVLLFRDDKVDIYRDDNIAVTVTTGIPGSRVPYIRWAQSGDTMIVTDSETGYFKLKREGSHTDWTWEEFVPDTHSFFQYNANQTLTAATTTVGTDRELSLSGTTAYWKAGHTDNILVKSGAGSTPGEATIKKMKQIATGGTAYSGSGTAANAFDSNNATTTAAGTDGWIGYDFGSDKTVRIVGIRSNATQTLTLACETDDNSSFSSATTVDTVTVEAVANDWVWFDVSDHTGEQFFRIRETGGEDLTVQELTFADGLTALADITIAFPSGAQTVWTEQVFGEHKGYPRAVTFAQERLYFFGVRDEPALFTASKSSDFFNFDMGDGDQDDDAFVFLIADDQSVACFDARGKRDGILVFTSDAEFEINGGGDAAITATNIIVNAESRYGTGNVPVGEVDGNILYVTANGKQLRSYNFEFASDQFVAQNLTDLVHHLFTDGQLPIGLSLLRSYADTQANLVFVPREDGTLCVLSIDSSREVLAWSRWTTEGSFGRCVVVDSPDTDGTRKPHLYAVVERTIDGSTKVFLEKLTEEERYLDCWEYGSDDPAKTSWSGAAHLANETVGAVGNGLVLNDVAVDGSGNFTTESAVSNVYVGFNYTSTLTTQYLALFQNNTAIRGQRVKVKSAIVDLYQTQYLKISGREVLTRTWDNDTFGGELSSFTGQKKFAISLTGSNSTRDPAVTVSVDQPLPCTILTLTFQIKAGRKR